MVQLVGLKESSHSLSRRLKNCGDGFIWVFIGIYGPTKRDLREELLEDLGPISGVWEDSWCIGGDFNVLRSPCKRNWEGRWTGAMRRFS